MKEMDLKEENRKSWRNFRLFLTGITIVLLVAMIILKATWLEIVHIITPFLMPFLAISIAIVTFIIFIIAIVKTIYNLVTKKRDNLFIDLIIDFLCLVVFFIPVDDYYEHIRFSLNKKNFERAIEILSESEPGINVALPEEYKHLSRGGGEIIIEGEGEAKVYYFYTFRGILDNYSVYAYTPNQKGYETLRSNEDRLEIEKLTDKWYHCSSR
ncbi:MAG TPA: hypothetical protein DCY94_01440 [Firmicutes bacterium]|nr:hypothetical protein [Bacillota bacterium]